MFLDRDRPKSTLDEIDQLEHRRGRRERIPGPTLARHPRKIEPLVGSNDPLQKSIFTFFARRNVAFLTRFIAQIELRTHLRRRKPPLTEPDDEHHPKRKMSDR